MIPNETLFMDFKDDFSYNYAEPTLSVPEKATIEMKDYGLIHYLIARNYDVNLIKYMLLEY